MRIVREPDEVATQLFRPAKKRLHILVGISAASAVRGFGVDGNAAQKDRLVVEQDFGASDLDGAEAQQFFHRIAARAKCDLVELGGFRRPAFKALHIEMESCASVCADIY